MTGLNADTKISIFNNGLLAVFRFVVIITRDTLFVCGLILLPTDHPVALK